MARAQENGQVRRNEWTSDELMTQAQKIMEIKEKVMRENIHFGIIPGCKKPSLWKAGAEKLCQAFRLEPQFETVGRDDPHRSVKWTKKDNGGGREIEGSTTGYVEYESQCTLIHIPTGEEWVRNVGGSCNNFESKYRTLNPYDVKNTIEKMADKRSLVAAVLIGTAASDIFTQDLEDMAYLNGDGNNGGQGDIGEPEPGAEIGSNGKAAGTGNGSGQASGNGGKARLATLKQVAFIKAQLKRKEIPEEEFFSRWAGDFTAWDSIPFERVNDILTWIRE
jgi:hypothetical protein